MSRYMTLPILTCLAGLLLVAACSPEPPYDEGYGGATSAPPQDCDPAMSGYCDEAPYQESDDYYPDYGGGAYYPGTGVVIVPEPVPVPTPAPRPRQPTPPKHRPPRERTCHPTQGHPCP